MPYDFTLNGFLRALFNAPILRKYLSVIEAPQAIAVIGGGDFYGRKPFMLYAILTLCRLIFYDVQQNTKIFHGWRGFGPRSTRKPFAPESTYNFLFPFPVQWALLLSVLPEKSFQCPVRQRPCA